MKTETLNSKGLKSLYSNISEKTYMVSLQNSKEFSAVLRRYGKIFTRILWEKSKVTNRIQLLTKFGDHLLRLNRNHGSVFVVKYLKACTVALQRFIGGQPLSSLREIEPDLPLPRLTSSGLPAFVPSRDRRAITALTVKVIRWYLTIFSVYRIISCPGKVKLNTITDPYSGKSEVLEEMSSWLLRNSKALLSQFTSSFEIQASLGLERITKSSPSAKESWAGFLDDAFSWQSRGNGAELSAFLGFGQFSLYYDLFEIWKAKLKPYTWSKADSVDLSATDSHLASRLKVIPTEPIEKPLGSLAPKEEAAGKVRVFAMVDIWTQSALKPLHDWLYKLFRNFPNDSTFNQDVGFIRAMSKAVKYNKAYCYDLSAATDRLPIQLQISILNSLFSDIEDEFDREGYTYGQAWANLLTMRSYHLNDKMRELSPSSPSSVKYAVGQPMGALSSWAMLNLTHHLILQFLFNRNRRKYVWCDLYEVLGDDIVIFDAKLASEYFEYMETGLGVKCNASKSLIAPNRPVVEFAKRVSIGLTEVSPFSWRQARSFDSLMGRASMAATIISRSHVPAPIRAFNALVGSTFDKTVSTRSYALIHFAAMAVNRGILNLKTLLKLLVDPKNPFRFIGARIIASIKVGWFEKLISQVASNSLEIEQPKFDPIVDQLDRLFDGFIRGYLVSSLEDKYLEIVERLKELPNSVEKLCEGVFPSDMFMPLFFPGKRFLTPPKRPDFESMELEEQLALLADYEQLLRDTRFYEIKPERKLYLENSLKLIKFVEKARKKGEIIVPVDNYPGSLTR